MVVASSSGMAQWARWIVRTAPFWLVVWPVAALLVWLPAPRIPSLLEDDATGFLPADMPSQRAQARLREAFPNAAPASRAAVVFVRESGLTDADRLAIADAATELNQRRDELAWRVEAAALSPHLRPLLESGDGQAAVVVVDLPAEFLTHSTVKRVRQLRKVIAGVDFDPGLEVEVTGTGALGELLDANAKRDVDRTTLWAFVAVSVILLVIYRSPVAMLLPVVTIVVSLMVSLGLVGWGAAAGLPINGLVEMFIVVILAGAGVDYCLFLFARFCEEMPTAADARDAIERALTHTGGAVLASAGTNVAGLATLALASNRDLYTSGPTIAFTICIATAAVLTLAPAMMCVVGRRLYWPRELVAAEHADSRLWSGVARMVTRRPGLVTLAVLAVMAIPAIQGARVRPLFDAYEEYPADSSFVCGARLYSRHFFGTEAVSEQTLVISWDEGLAGAKAEPALRASLDALAEMITERYPLLYLRDLQDPLGRRRSTAAADTVLDRLGGGLIDRQASTFYVGTDGRSTRVDFALGVEPRSAIAMDWVAPFYQDVREVLDRTGFAAGVGARSVTIDLAGETPIYADMRGLRRADFRIIAIAAIALVFLILVWLIRSPAWSLVLVAATVLTYFAAYGATWLVFHTIFGLPGLNWQIDFLLFIIILSLGQDYNIYVVSRMTEELPKRPPREAIEIAVARTGRVVSSCGLIMAAAFASMMAGSLVIMKEFAVALSVGILIDTFIVRPLLVPAILLILTDRRRSTRYAATGPDPA